jgi:hypothetical protein
MAGFHVPLLVAWLLSGKGFSMSHYTPTHLLVQAYHPIRFSGFMCVVLPISVISVAVAVQAVAVEVVAMEMCNRRSV